MGLSEAIAVGVIALALIVPFGIHQIPEGHVGVYWRGGALLSSVTSAGIHTKIPFITSVEYVQTTMQSDQVREIPCGTRGGVMIYFEKVEIVNRLKEHFVLDTIRNYTVQYDKLWIFDRVHHEINEICSAKTLEQIYITEFHTLDELLAKALTNDINKYAPGIEIITVRVTKPRIPESIRLNYEEMEVQRTKLLIAIEEQKVIQLKGETDKLKATIEAQKHSAVSEIMMRMMKEKQLSEQQISEIENEIHLLKETGLADAKFYMETQTAKANKLKLTPAYMKLEAMSTIRHNLKTYFTKSGSELLEFWGLSALETKDKATQS